MKKILALVMIAVFALALAGCGGSKVGKVDTERVMQGSAKVKKIQEEMMVKQGDARKKMDDLNAQKDKMKDDEYQAKQKAIYEDFKKVQEEADKNFQNTMKVAMEKVIKDRGLDVIIYKDAIAEGGIDVTDDIMKALDADMPKADATKAAPAASGSAAPATSGSAAPSASGK